MLDSNGNPTTEELSYILSRENYYVDMLGEDLEIFEQRHLQNYFENGGIKFGRGSWPTRAGDYSNIDIVYETIINAEPGKEREALVEALALTDGYLDGSDAFVSVLNKDASLKLPLGSDFPDWIGYFVPGGKTGGGLPEAATTYNLAGWIVEDTPANRALIRDLNDQNLSEQQREL